VVAQAAASAHRPDLAEAAFKKALAERPEGSQALWELGQFYLDQGRYDAATATFQQLANLQPSPRVFLSLGRAQEGGYHYYAAKNSYAQAVALAPDDRGIATYYAAFKQRMAREVTQNKDLAIPPP
jgi:tetratricopeptide (TPR) repeat protein